MYILHRGVGLRGLSSCFLFCISISLPSCQQFAHGRGSVSRPTSRLLLFVSTCETPREAFSPVVSFTAAELQESSSYVQSICRFAVDCWGMRLRGAARCLCRTLSTFALCPPFLFLVVPQLDIVYWVFAPGRSRHRLAPCIPWAPSDPWMSLLRNFE